MNNKNAVTWTTAHKRVKSQEKVIVRLQLNKNKSKESQIRLIS